MRNSVIATLFLAVLTLTGCAQKDASPFDRVEFMVQPGGVVYAEVWIEAPSIKGCHLEGDTAQDVVALVHPNGRMALPDRVRFTGKTEDYFRAIVDPSGEVPISVYHLTKMGDDLEVGYYKRKFARANNK